MSDPDVLERLNELLRVVFCDSPACDIATALRDAVAEIERLRTPAGARAVLLAAITGSVEAITGTPSIAADPPTVERVEMVSYETGHREEAPPTWRITLNGVCAEFPTETWARNFAAEIARASAPSADALSRVRAEALEEAAKIVKRERDGYGARSWLADMLDRMEADIRALPAASPPPLGGAQLVHRLDGTWETRETGLPPLADVPPPQKFTAEADLAGGMKAARDLISSIPTARAVPPPLAAARDGLHCVYGECQGPPRHPRPCNPGCYFQMSAISDLELLRRMLEAPPPPRPPGGDDA